MIDVVGVVQNYILTLLEEAGPGMKVMLLDSETTPAVSLAFAQSALMRQEVFLFERLTAKPVWEDMRYLPGAGETPVLLILNRREDPVTPLPLLSQWTYQAMVHQLIGINNNRVSLARVPGDKKDLQEIMLNASQDEFYTANIYANFGEIGQTIKVLMEEFQNKAKSHEKIDSISDMKNFIEHYPQFKKMSGTVSKHVTLVSELSRLVAARNLLPISELEQEIVAQGDHKEMLRSVTEMIQKESTTLEDATRLAMLFTLRFESSYSSSVRTQDRDQTGQKEGR